MGLQGMLGVQGCLKCQKNEKKMQLSLFLKISVQFMATRGHYRYCILCSIHKQCMKYICVKFGASAV